MSAWLKEKGSAAAAVAGMIAALVAALQLFVVGPMNQRFDDLRAYMDQRFDAQDERMRRLEAETSRRFDAMDARFNAMDARFDAHQTETNRRFDAVLEAIMGFDRRVSRNEGQIEVIREQLQAEGTP